MNAIPRWLFYFAVITAFLTWCLIIVGGIVHGTGSSLACPDWPTCYGTFFPEMTGGVFFEHSHRILATAVGFLSILLCAGLLWKGNRKLKILGVGAVILVIFQGVLGGITVIYKLPTAVSTAHLATSMLFLGLMVWIASECGALVPQAAIRTLNLRSWILPTMILVYFQIVLGGLVRHTGAGLACADIPLCRGSLWPVDALPILKVHMLHRLMAVVVALAVFFTSYKVYREQKDRYFLKILALSAPILIAVQITLGLLSIQSYLALIPVTTHLAVGALLWVNMVLFYKVS